MTLREDCQCVTRSACEFITSGGASLAQPPAFKWLVEAEHQVVVLQDRLRTHSLVRTSLVQSSRRGSRRPSRRRPGGPGCSTWSPGAPSCASSSHPARTSGRRCSRFRSCSRPCPRGPGRRRRACRRPSGAARSPCRATLASPRWDHRSRRASCRCAHPPSRSCRSRGLAAGAAPRCCAWRSQSSCRYFFRRSRALAIPLTRWPC
mmetsp:Transcript_93150/g.301161  ORF Transcript_93150/g.301161 Transcript_93150/m.301161 type:complete len:205 (-) Transcript_93150:1042-1656(-)